MAKKKRRATPHNKKRKKGGSKPKPAKKKAQQRRKKPAPKKPKKSRRPAKARAAKRADRSRAGKPRRKPAPAKRPARKRPREFRPFVQRIYRDAKTGRLISERAAKRRKSGVVVQEIRRAAVPGDVQRLRLADGTLIREGDYQRLQGLFNWMREAGIDLSQYSTVRDVKGEYEAVKGQAPRQRAAAVDRMRQRVDRATRRRLGA